MFAKLLNSRGLLPVVVVLATVPFLLLCFYNQPNIDDYGLATLFRKHGFWQAQYQLYHQLNGRFVTSLLLTGLSPLSYGWQNGLQFTSLVIDVATLLALGFSLQSLLGPAISPRQLGLLTGGIFLVFVAIIPDVYSALYWYAAQTTHHLASLFLLLIPVSVARAHRTTGRAARGGWLGLAASGTVLVAGSGEVTAVLLGWLLGVAAGLSAGRRAYRHAGIWAGLLLLLGGTALFHINAPSNWHRLHASSHETGVTTSLAHFWHPAWLVRALRLFLWQPNTLLILVVPLLCYPLAAAAVAVRPAGFRLPLLGSSVVLLGGVGLGMALMQLEICGENVVPRCANVLLWWLLLGWLAACWAAAPAELPPLAGPLRVARTSSALLLGVLICVPVGRAWRELLVDAPAWNEQSQHRYAFLRQVAQQHPHAKVLFPPIHGVTPHRILVSNYYDLGQTYQPMLNRETAAYFGVDSVRVEPTAQRAISQ